MDDNQELNQKQSDQQPMPDPAPTEADTSHPTMLPDQPSGTDPKMGPDPSSTPKNDDSPQAVVKDQPMPPVKVASQEKSTSPMSVNETGHEWFKQAEIEDIRSRWTAIQIQFVDEPCSAVEQGEALVAETVERVKQMISDQQQSLGQQWLNHDDISTEELRSTLLNYRLLLNQMLKL